MLTPLLLIVPETFRVLFVGNSLLNGNDVPGTVARMLQSDGSGRRVVHKAFFVGHLEDVRRGTEVDREVASGRYDVVVLQSAMVSSSMTRTYAQTRGIEMAKAARAAKARVILYVEWPRRGINETEYTLNVYRGIAKASGAEVLPVCYAWNEVVRQAPGLGLWSPDGNHSTAVGAYVAAASVYTRLAGAGRTPSFRPAGVDARTAAFVLGVCRKVEAQPAASKKE